MIVGHSLSWYDGSLHHLVHHSSITAPGCNLYHSDIIVISANVWMPEMLSPSNASCLSSSPVCSTVPPSLTTSSHHPSLSRIHSDESDHDDEGTSAFNSSYLQAMPSQWDPSIIGNDFLPVYNHQQQQQPGTTTYDDDQLWYERLRSMATSSGNEQQSSSDSSSTDIQQQQHHQLFDVYPQHLPPPMLTSVTLDPHLNYYSGNQLGFDPYHYHHHHHHHQLSEYQTMFSF